MVERGTAVARIANWSPAHRAIHSKWFLVSSAEINAISASKVHHFRSADEHRPAHGAESFRCEGCFAQSGGDTEAEADADKLDIPIHAFDVIIADECHRGYHVRILAKRLLRIDKDMNADARTGFVMANDPNNGHFCSVKITENTREYEPPLTPTQDAEIDRRLEEHRRNPQFTFCLNRAPLSFWLSSIPNEIRVISKVAVSRVIRG
jgi:hypothetical protein